MSVTRNPRTRLQAEPSRGNFRAIRLLWYVLPALPLLPILLAVFARDIGVEGQATPVKVVVQPQPEQKITAYRPTTPVFKAVIKDEPPEFNPALAAPPPVKVTIVDEKEERPPVKPLPVKVTITDENDGLRNIIAGQPVQLFEVDPRPRVLWQYGPGMRFGITATETGKRLTYAVNGSTNQTLLRVNGQEGEFGGPAGKFFERDAKLPPNAGAKSYAGSRSVWVSGKIVYTQILELVPSGQPFMVAGKPRLVLDTVRVRYIIENKDAKPFKVGLRTQIDTLIGANDGVPFTVPGMKGMVIGFADFPKVAPIPDFIQALERPNLQNPGTVAHMSLKIGGVEAPTRVCLTHWPGGGFPSWEVPLVPIGNDSAVVLYWQERPLAPGEKREMGFAYGLGSVVSTDAGGKLGITLGGSFEPGESFSVTAYVQSPIKGQTLTLELPRGLQRIDGDETQKVPPIAPLAPSSIVTWQVKVLETGSFPLKVTSSNGLSQTKIVSIARPEPAPELRLGVDLLGSFEPGQEFEVVAKLTSTGAAPSSNPTMTLPIGLKVVRGPSLTAEAPPANKGSLSVATWKVKVVDAGKYAVRVEWGGAALTKVVSIVRPEIPTGGYVSMRLEPPFAPGKVFGVTATVSDPLPGQTLTLELPTGMRLVEGQPVVPISRGKEATTVVHWKVMVYQPGAFPLRLISSAGLTLKKTIVIEEVADKGGDFTLDHVGEIAPGKDFTVRAKVADAVAGQKLTLLPLPRGLQLTDGPAEQTVPPDGLLTWRVRVLGNGTFAVRVASTTGVVQGFTMTLTMEEPSGPVPQLFGGSR